MSPEQPMSRAERARAAVEEEKKRFLLLEKKIAEEAGDVVVTAFTSALPASQATTPEPNARPSEQPPRNEPTTVTPESPIGVSADRPIEKSEKKKPDRQGIDLRPEDRDRVDRFELFCLKNRLTIGRKRGLSLYARAGLQLLDELILKDPAAATKLLRSLGESKRRPNLRLVRSGDESPRQST